MFVGAARALDIPARYVTGYLAGSDEAAASFHAWAEAYDDSLGWIAFDAALGYCPTDQHVRLATGLDSLTTMPLRSVPNGSKPELVTLSVDAGQQ
jgi:transglutaminase-like putative cysteine protease